MIGFCQRKSGERGLVSQTYESGLRVQIALVQKCPHGLPHISIPYPALGSVFFETKTNTTTTTSTKKCMLVTFEILGPYNSPVPVDVLVHPLFDARALSHRADGTIQISRHGRDLSESEWLNLNLHSWRG